MSSMDMYKVITPLDYLGPSETLISEANITATSSSRGVTWTGSDNKNLSACTDDRVILMDNILLTTSKPLTGGGGDQGIFSFDLTLTPALNQILSRYCKFRFRFNFQASAVGEMQVNVTLKTPIIPDGYTLTTVYNSGISTKGAYVTPDFDIDWSTSGRWTNYVS